MSAPRPATAPTAAEQAEMKAKIEVSGLTSKLRDYESHVASMNRSVFTKIFSISDEEDTNTRLAVYEAVMKKSPEAANSMIDRMLADCKATRGRSLEQVQLMRVNTLMSILHKQHAQVTFKSNMYKDASQLHKRNPTTLSGAMAHLKEKRETLMENLGIKKSWKERISEKVDSVIHRPRAGR